MTDNSITIITPTTGKKSLNFLINSISSQTERVPVKHLLMWDSYREGDFVENRTEGNYSIKSFNMGESMIQGEAKGSWLRSIALMIADTEWVTFADDDIMWEPNHVETCIGYFENKNWGYCKRRIWTKSEDGYENLGIDEFESVGEDAKTPYKMVDNNSMFFRRRLGTSASVLYRETQDYNDDRLMYAFLKQYAGEPFKTNMPTVNQICPNKLIEFFRANCTKDDDNKNQ